MLALLQGGKAAALIMEPTPIAQAMRQTALAPAQPCLYERIANSVTVQRLSLSLQCEHEAKAACGKGVEKNEKLCF